MKTSVRFDDGTVVSIFIDELRKELAFNALIHWPDRSRDSTWIGYRKTFVETHAACSAHGLSPDKVARVRRELTLLEKRSRRDAAEWFAYINKLPLPETSITIPIDVATWPMPEIPDYSSLVKESMDRQADAMGNLRYYRSGKDLDRQIDLATGCGLSYRLESAWRHGWKPIADDGRKPWDKTIEYCIALVDGVLPRKIQCIFCGHKLMMRSQAAQREHMRYTHGIVNIYADIWPRKEDEK